MRALTIAMEGYFLCVLVCLSGLYRCVSSNPGELDYADYSDSRACRGLKCQNGGLCQISEYGSAQCLCRYGYTGTACQYKTGAHLSIENLKCNNTCSRVTSCRFCQSCETCSFETLCLSYQTLINDLDRECHLQGFQEALLVKASTSPTGYSQLRCGDVGSSLDCPSGSLCVPDGRGAGVCCRSSVGIELIRNKPGSCPPSSESQLCGQLTCTSDFDCAGNLKCCPQCGYRCTIPYQDPCTNVACNNGGRCVSRGQLAYCECPSGFTGNNCELRIDPCSQITCLNGGRCVSRGLDCHCECPAGVTGQYCEVRQAPCASITCNNGGRCLSRGQEAYCECPIGFVGQFCELRQDPCSLVRCNNGGRCVTRGLDAYCECPTGFTGQYCQVRQDTCASVTCANGGRCVPQGVNFTCECTNDYIGQFCEIAKDPCLSVRCAQGAKCYNRAFTAYCDCPKGFTGQYCERTADPCEGVRCLNGGLCVAAGSVGYCQCPAGFTGAFCQTQTDPCLTVRCQNSGRCVVKGSSPVCECPVGFVGAVCETRIDPCLNYRCENGGRCLDIGGRPYCECSLGYTGYRCETRLAPTDTRDLTCNNTCSLQTSCRVCLTCDTCRAESLCLENQRLIKDLDRECQSCGYLEALLVKTTQSPLGYTPLHCSGSYTCPSGSACVEDGRGSGTCCRNKVGPGYLDNKPGTCPLGSHLTCGGASCQRDSDCAGSLKCCPSCGNQCVAPVLPLQEQCRTCASGTVCATVDRCPASSGVSCPDEQKLRCVPDNCRACPAGEKCRVVLDERLCTAGQDCDRYVYQCAPVQVTNCSSLCGTGSLCSPIGKSCLIQAGNSNRQCDVLSRCQRVRQCPECATGLYCRDSTAPCGSAPCPQTVQCVNPCGSCSPNQTCQPTGSNSFQCISSLPCGGCPAGQICREVQSWCGGQPCLQSQCVVPTSDQCGGCPVGFQCQHISSGCPTANCSPATYRCVSGSTLAGQCPVVVDSWLDSLYCKVSSVPTCARDQDCVLNGERCCPDHCGSRTCKRVT